MGLVLYAIIKRIVHLLCEKNEAILGCCLFTKVPYFSPLPTGYLYLFEENSHENDAG